MVCGDGLHISTSTLLLAAISPWLRWLMEEAGEEFCLCLPSVTARQLEDFLNTCLAVPDGQDLAQLAMVHSLLVPGTWTQGSQPLQAKVALRRESLDKMVPHVKLEELGGVMQPSSCRTDEYVEGDLGIGNRNRSKTDRKNMPRKVRAATPEEDSENDIFDPYVNDDDDYSDDNYSEEEKRKTGKVKASVESGEKVEKLKKKRGRPKNSGKPSRDLLCQECGQEFIKGSRKDITKVYQRHLLKHQVENFFCQCPNVPKIIPRPGQERIGMDFKQKERHMKVEHQGWLGCQECIQSFETEEQLTEHVEKHRLTFICDLCGFVAPNPQSLKDHTKKKHESIPMPCPECGKIMGSKIAVDSHKRKVHSASACIICGVVIKNMKIHMQEMHIDDSEKRYQCQDCGKGFMDKQRLTDHRMNMHIKSQPHKCRYGCENRYNDKSNRNAHERRRHGEVYNANHARNALSNFVSVINPT